MVANLDPRKITFDARTGRYRSPFGGFLSQSDINIVVQSEHTRLAQNLDRLAVRLLNERITIAEFEEKAFKEEASRLLSPSLLY